MSKLECTSTQENIGKNDTINVLIFFWSILSFNPKLL